MGDRRDYFFKQKVTEAELDIGFDTLEQAERNLSIDLGLAGIIQNGAVTENSPQDLQVFVSGPLTARSSLGERLTFPAPLLVDLSTDGNLPVGAGGTGDGVSTAVAGSGNERWIGVFMVFDRILSDDRTDGNGLTVSFVRTESFHFVIVASAEEAAPIPIGSAPATPAGAIRFADVRLAFGQTQIANADIDLTNRDDSVIAQAGQVSVVDNFVNISGITDVQDTLEALDGIVINKDGSVAFTGNQPMGNNKITGLAVPTVGTDAARKTEVDAKANDADVIKKDGSVAFTGNQPMGNNKITGLAVPTVGTDAARKTEVDLKANDADVIKEDGSVPFSGDQDMGTNKLTGVGVPDIDSTDAARKVDFQNIALGSVQNLAITTSGGSPDTDVTVTADSVVLVDANGNSVRRTSISHILAIDGSGANGLDTGSEASSTWYYIWVIYNGTITATLFSLSPTAPTLPSGYTFKYLVGARFNDSGSDLVRGFQKDEIFLRDEAISLRSAIPSVASTFEDLDYSDEAPPIVEIAIVELGGTAGAVVTASVSWRRKGATGTGHLAVEVEASSDRNWTQAYVAMNASQVFEVTASHITTRIDVQGTGFVFPL